MKISASLMNICERLTNFVRQVFKTSLEIFLQALKLSPNAQGYVRGSITELLLSRKLEQEYGFEVKRILEKWEGKKHSRHHGDFYFRKQGVNCWYVLESKGVKSNSEKWHKLYNYENMKNFLIRHAGKIGWINPNKNSEQQIKEWISKNLPKFQNDYAFELYEYEEVKNYSKPKRETQKAKAIDFLRSYTREQINDMIENRLNYVRSKVEILETHFVSGTSGSGERTQATPRKDEFSVVAIDIALRYPEHKFLFANPQNLESSGDDAEHLQQNYVMGFVFFDMQGNPILKITDEWSEDFHDVYATLDPANSVKEDDMQIDNRNVD